jgi:hypothetical protein
MDYIARLALATMDRVKAEFRAESFNILRVRLKELAASRVRYE